MIAIWVGAGPDEHTADTADAAVVLGAAVDDDTPSPVFAARIDHAITLHRDQRVQTIVFTGGKSAEDSLPEAEAARAYAISKGVPTNVILMETSSRTTHENLTRAMPMLEEAGIETIMIVSDPLHLRRAWLMADDLGLDAKASATPTTRYQSWPTKLPFLLREVYFIHHFWVLGE